MPDFESKGKDLLNICETDELLIESKSHNLCLGKFYIIRSQEKNLNQEEDSDHDDVPHRGNYTNFSENTYKNHEKQ